MIILKLAHICLYTNMLCEVCTLVFLKINTNNFDHLGMITLVQISQILFYHYHSKALFLYRTISNVEAVLSL